MTRVMKKLEKLRANAVRAYVFPNFNKKFEVALNGHTFVVDLIMQKCTCRRWDLTGIPCVHTCSAIYYVSEEPSAYVHDYYTVERYLEAYKYALEPLVSEQMWPEAEGYKVQPPSIRKMLGWPKKVRRRDPEEDPKNPRKLRRFGLVMTCSNCQQKGHNSKTCGNEKVPKPSKGKRGRPRKNPSQPPMPKQGKEQTQATSKGKDKRSASKGKAYLHMPGTAGLVYQNKTSSSNATKSNATRAKEGPSTHESRNPTAN